jgi:ABC-type branched-subunit amino acid transport system substrate-binding protein
MLYPRSGPAGIWSPACDASAMLAAAEINAAGGILRDEVELVFADCGLSEGEAMSCVDSLLDIEQVDAIIGNHTSNLRDAVSRRISSRVPYIYTAQYEGVPVGPSTIAIGSTDSEILHPTLHWLINEKRASKFYFLGNDYIWPHMVLSTTRRLLRKTGAELVGQSFIPITHVDHENEVRKVRQSGADVVVLALVGNCGVTFNRAFAEAGLDEKVLRLALIVDETVLCAIGAENSPNLYTASHYFSDEHSRGNDRFLELYHEAFGELAPPVSAVSVSCYEGLHVLAGLAREQGSRNPLQLASHLKKPMTRRFARNSLSGKPVGQNPVVHIAQAEGLSMRVVASLSSE